MTMPELPPDVMRQLRKKAALYRVGAALNPLAGVYAVVAGSITMAFFVSALENRTLVEVLVAVLEVLVACVLLTAPLLLLFAPVGGRLFHRDNTVRVAVAKLEIFASVSCLARFAVDATILAVGNQDA